MRRVDPAAALLLLASLLAGCSATPSLEGEPLTPEEIDYQRRLEQAEQVPLDESGRSRLLREIDQNLEHWQRANLELVGSADRRLVANLEEILQRTVYLDFDVVLDFLETGTLEQRTVAAAALGFARLREPADPAERESFLARWPQVYGRAVEPLARALDSEHQPLIQNALLGLWKLGDPRTPLPPVLRQLQHEEAEVRAMAALALSSILTQETGEAAISGLVNALYDGSPKVRNHAVTAVGRIRHRAAAGRLAQLLDDHYLLIQANAAKALGQLGDWRNAEFLLGRLEALLRDKPSGKFRPQSDLDQRRELVAGHLIEALERLSGEQHGDDMEKWLEWWRERAARG